VMLVQRFHGGVKIGCTSPGSAASSRSRPARTSSRCAARSRETPNSHLRPVRSWFACASPCWWSPSRASDVAQRSASSSASPGVSERGITARSIGNAQRSTIPSSPYSRSSSHPASSSRRKKSTAARASSSAARSGASKPLSRRRSAWRPLDSRVSVSTDLKPAALVKITAGLIVERGHLAPLGSRFSLRRERGRVDQSR
jgi:hypothetical protein